ncbi:MAG TPA: dTDP-4-dehydrorhamnose reductase [Azonexus sp.]|nr:dTDP-4-dehydrorhamnose reductase [Azonexus sp.]
MGILLLGKDGQLGWELQRALAPLAPLVACGRGECDLSDPAALRVLVAAARPAVIVNAAAYTAVDKAESDAATAHAINAEAPRVLAECAAASGGLLIHYSTDYVYDGNKASPYVETDAVAPQSVYGRSKLSGEEGIRASGARSLVFRTSWVFGEHGGNFVRTVLRLARERDSLSVVDDQVGSPTPAALIADVTAAALLRLDLGRRLGDGESRLYHLAAANPLSWCGFARRIVELAGGRAGGLRFDADAVRAIPSAEYPTPARRPANSRLDCSRLAVDFDLHLPDWEPYLQRMLAQIVAR